MKTINLLFLVFLLFSISSGLFAQDLILTFKGEIDNKQTSLDSIFIENLSNGTNMGFGNLPIRNDYRINLTQKSFWGSTSIEQFTKSEGFYITKNLPGKLAIGYRNYLMTDVYLTVYTINGQLVASSKQIINSGNTLQIEIETMGVYLINVTTKYETQIFKAIGLEGTGKVTILSSLDNGNAEQIKSESLNLQDDFSFNQGDSLKLSVFKVGYSTEPKLVKASSSESYIFPLLKCSTTDITTLSADEITTESAILRGQIVKESSCGIIERGFFWSKTNSSPNLNDNKIVVSDTSLSFSTKLKDLGINTTCYYVAYVLNSSGTIFGKVKNFTTGTIIDSRDGHNYKMVKIGKQTWMSENMAYLPSVSIQTTGSLHEKIYYVNAFIGTNVDSAKLTKNYKTYGVLYNWPAATEACPTGWHIPLMEEWDQLENYLADNGYNYDGTKGGGGKKIAKALSAQTNWLTSDVFGSPGNDMSKNNSSGFSAVAGGLRSSDSWFVAVEWSGNWWSRTDFRNESKLFWQLYYKMTETSRYYISYNEAISVRCLMDDSTTIKVPNVNTSSISQFNQTTAVLGGEVISDGGDSVSSRGVCWSLSKYPSIYDNKSTNGAGIGIFSLKVTGLLPNTTYYVRAYATNNAGTAYGEEFSFTTEKIALPTITTDSIYNTTLTTAHCRVRLIATGGEPLSIFGICWSNSPHPTNSDHIATLLSNIDSTRCTLSNLKINTTYFVRAFAHNSAGFAYGNEISFKISYDSITDARDGHTYYAIKIGPKTWMTKNLEYLPSVNNITNLSFTEKRYYIYNYNDTVATTAKNSEYYSKYGVLYNFPAAQEACPVGWHLPSDEEWMQLEEALEMSPKTVLELGYRGYYKQGVSLKATNGWTDSRGGSWGNGTNTSGFSGLPGGYLDNSGKYFYAGTYGNWWCSTIKNDFNSFTRGLSSSYDKIERASTFKSQGISVRCVKD